MSAALSQRVDADACFSRVIVGVDDSPASLAAVRQGAVLTEPEGTIELLAAYETEPGLAAPAPIFLDARRDRDCARGTLRDALLSLPPSVTVDTTTIAPGPLSVALLQELQWATDTLAVVSATADSTAAQVLAHAPCSVLVARPADASAPKRIVVGVDGSPESAVAYAAAREIARRFGGQVTALVALGGSPHDARAVEQIVRWAKPSHDEAATALIDASATCDLLVLGNRGLHGVDGLGSVAERVALGASCSVLVVRHL